MIAVSENTKEAPSRTGSILVNIIHIFTAIFLLWDFESNLHFLQSSFIRNINLISILVYLIQGLIGFS